MNGLLYQAKILSNKITDSKMAIMLITITNIQIFIDKCHYQFPSQPDKTRVPQNANRNSIVLSKHLS